MPSFNLALWLASIVPGLTKRVLAALGFAVVMVAGLEAVTAQLIGYIYSSVGGITGDTLALINLAGFSTGLNIIIGAISARLALYVLANSSRIVGI